MDVVGDAFFPLHIWHGFMVPVHEGKKYLPFLDPMEVRGPEIQEFENLSSEASSLSEASSSSQNSVSSDIPAASGEPQNIPPETPPDEGPGTEPLELQNESEEPPDGGPGTDNNPDTTYV